MLGNREDARDAAQDTFLRCWQSGNRPQEPEALFSWLAKSVTNRCIDQLRRRRRFNVLLAEIVASLNRPSETVQEEEAVPRPGSLCAPGIDNLEYSIDELNASMSGLIPDLPKVYTFWEDNGERIMLVDLDPEEYDPVETNGRILKTGRDRPIVWPAEGKELFWKLKLVVDSESIERNRPKMLEMWREYRAKN